jgi:uncharacterized membrane protein YecN with MAPEG domain
MPPALARLTSLSLGGLGLVAGLAGWWFIAQSLAVPDGASTMGVRLGMAAAALVPSAALLFLMILASSAARFATATFDPLAGRDPHFIARNQRVIGNTVEQFSVFVPALAAWAAGGGAAAMPAVLAAALVFAIARTAFWIGYHAHGFARAPGMAATLAINALALWMAGRAWLG